MVNRGLSRLRALKMELADLLVLGQDVIPDDEATM